MKEPSKFVAWLDRVITPYLPGWVVNLCVSMAFAFTITAAAMTLPAFASFDLTWYWSVTSRAVFGTLTTIFCLVLISKGSK